MLLTTEFERHGAGEVCELNHLSVAANLRGENQPMKRKKSRCPLVPDGKDSCPLQQAQVVIVRTERRSWLTLAITGFGARLVRYLKTVRERRRIGRKK